MDIGKDASGEIPARHGRAYMESRPAAMSACAGNLTQSPNNDQVDNGWRAAFARQRGIAGLAPSSGINIVAQYCDSHQHR